MTEPLEQPPCFFIGATVRQDRMTPPRDTTPGIEAVEANLSAVADDPALALNQYETRARDQQILQDHNFIEGDEYAVLVAGQCLGEIPHEGCCLVANPSQPIRSGQIVLMRVRGETMSRAKFYLGRMAEIAGAEQVFTEKPNGVFVFWLTRPAMMLAVAGQDLLAADLVVARIENGSDKRHSLLGDVLTAGDRAQLGDTLAFLDRSPLRLTGKSAFQIDQDMLKGFADKAQTASPGQRGEAVAASKMASALNSLFNH